MITLKVNPINIKTKDGIKPISAFFGLIPTDSELDENSIGAVQNKVVAEAINGLKAEIEGLESIEGVEY